MIVWDFFIDNLPSWKLIWMLGPTSILYALITLYISGSFKLRRDWKTGYSRKLFHFFIFGLASLVQVRFGYPGTIVFGSSVSLVVFYAVFKGSGNILFEAMAREKDAPKRSHYIIVPYVATLAGGVLNNFMFPPEIAVLGYLVAGFGDAIAEPVGTRFGRHRYRVPSFSSVKSYRSMEGSIAVFTGSFVALLLGGSLSGVVLLPVVLVKYLAIAGIASLTEAVSPHGWDNFTLQVVTGLVCYWLIF